MFCSSKSPAVSVIVATFNRALFLPETIDSILMQSFQDFELIVVDDGSTDNTREIVDRYGPRLQYLYQENRGPSAARNLGVKHARAPWIAFQDSDDLSLANHLESLYRYTREFPDCGMVFGNGRYIGAPEHDRDTIIPAKKSRRLAEKGVRLADLFTKSIVRLQASLIARKVYDAIGGHDETLWISMDLDLAFRIFMNAPVGYLDQSLFAYRKHEGNIGRDQERRLTENIRVIEKLLRDYPQAYNLLGRTAVTRRLAYRYYRLAKGRWRRGDPTAARHAIDEAISLRPFHLKYRFYQYRWGRGERKGLIHGI
jgi:glycosyltransferase involved in cell wall biosynthesis